MSSSKLGSQHKRVERLVRPVFLVTLIEITLRHRCSLVNLLHIFRTPFYKNTSGGLFLIYDL